MMTCHIPAWVTYPGEDWFQISPREAGLETETWQGFLAEHPVTGAQWEGEVHGAGEWGAVLTRGGCLVRTWGNPDYRFQSASLGKAFTWAVFGLAVDAGMIQPDDRISDTWTGEGQLSHPHKYLDDGHHKTLTWRHILGARDKYAHYGGFPVTNGYY